MRRLECADRTVGDNFGAFQPAAHRRHGLVQASLKLDPLIAADLARWRPPAARPDVSLLDAPKRRCRPMAAMSADGRHVGLLGDWRFQRDLLPETITAANVSNSKGSTGFTRC